MRLWRADGSSNIRAVGYDDGKIQVEFSSGARYEYGDVDEEDFLGILTADSVGRRVHEVLVSNKKPCVKLREALRGDAIDVLSEGSVQEVREIAGSLLQDMAHLTVAIKDKHPLIMGKTDRTVDVAIKLIGECTCRD